MKKAEDYIIETETDHWADQDYCKSDIISWIKQAQIDAIEEAVKMCSENARAIFADYGRKIIDVDKESILQVINELRKQL